MDDEHTFAVGEVAIVRGIHPLHHFHFMEGEEVIVTGPLFKCPCCDQSHYPIGHPLLGYGMVSADSRVLHKRKPPRDELASIRHLFNPTTPAADPDKAPVRVGEKETAR